MASSWMSLHVASGCQPRSGLTPAATPLGVQCDPAAVAGAGGVGVVPAVVTLTAGYDSDERIVAAVVRAVLVPAAVLGPAAPFVADGVDETGGGHEGCCAQRSGYQHRVPSVQRVERQRHEEVRHRPGTGTPGAATAPAGPGLGRDAVRILAAARKRRTARRPAPTPGPCTPATPGIHKASADPCATMSAKRWWARWFITHCWMSPSTDMPLATASTPAQAMTRRLRPGPPAAEAVAARPGHWLERE